MTTKDFLEFLIKTNYQVFSYKDNTYMDITGLGSGFMVDYKGYSFFVTVDHNIHPSCRKEGIIKRTGEEKAIAILNNVPDENGTGSYITPLSALYFMDKYELTDELVNSCPFTFDEAKAQLLDVAVCMMKEINFKYPFYTNQVNLVDYTFEAGGIKIPISGEDFTTPSFEDDYFIYGIIKPCFSGMALNHEGTLKQNLKYKGIHNNNYILQPPYKTVYDDWAGLSGAPVFNQYGKCIGIQNGVFDGIDAIAVTPIDHVRILMDRIISDHFNPPTKNV